VEYAVVDVTEYDLNVHTSSVNECVWPWLAAEIPFSREYREATKATTDQRL
jgi:hypothetical protein